MSNALLESLWARVDTNIGSRITKISELLTQSLSANDESKAARDAAAASATEAKNHADRAELATDVSGLRDEVTQQIAAVVDGSPAALDTIREVAEYAQANRGITDQLNAAIGDKANKSHTHTTSQVTGLDDALSGKASKTHTHTKSQVTGLDTALNGKSDTGHKHTTSEITDFSTEMGKKANASHTHASADITDTTSELMSINPNRVVRTNGDGSISIHNHTITGDYSAANKAYVDGEVAKKANKSHTHSQSDITGLSTALSGKADKSHTHTTSQITDYPGHSVYSGSAFYGFIPVREPDSANIQVTDDPAEWYHVTHKGYVDAALDEKADKTYVDARPAIFTVPDINSASTENLVPGDVVVDTSTWIFYYLK